LIGGLAVGARSEPRFTRDADLAVVASSDQDAEALVFALGQRGFLLEPSIEQTAKERLATVRLRAPGRAAIVVDLLFSSSGIEKELVRSADVLEVLEGLLLPVASLPHLVALKVLSRAEDRPQDDMDLAALLKRSTMRQVESARRALRMIHARGYGRGKDLEGELDRALLRFRRT
jgi:predicted nucleotidyltransferase